ncbi:glycosyltransferase [Providencia rettgeri]
MNHIAIIMSIYSKDDINHFKIAMESLFSQSYSVDIFLYIDGFIDRNKIALIERYKQRDNVYVIHSEKNLGLAFGLNTLIDNIIKHEKKYKYIARMDSDDISHPSRIEKQINYLERNQSISVLGTFCKEFGSSFALDIKKLPLEHEEITKFSIIRSPLVHPTVMFRSEIFHKGFRYPLNTNFTEDMAFWFILIKSGYKFSNLNEVLLDYRLNEDTVSRRKGLKKSISEIKLRFKYMFLLKQTNLKNITFILSRLLFHSLPAPILKYLYARFR